MERVRPTWRSRTWIAAIAVLATLLLAMTFWGAEDAESTLVVFAAIFVVVILIVVSAALRTRAERRRYEDEIAAWAAERAAASERIRIARELHDLASHGLGLITVRAAVARRLDGPESDAERMRALVDIERASRQATTELRRMLALLRSAEPAPLHPAETLDALPAIVQRASEAGAEVSLDMDGLGDVSSGVQLAVCAAVREGLGNALRHSGPTRASVLIRREDDEIWVEVADEGPWPGWQPHPGAGQGLAGLEERIAALGGSLHTAPAGDGWRLVARIPDRDRA